LSALTRVDRDIISRGFWPRISMPAIDSDLSPKTRTAINSFLVRQGVKNFDAW
jgi:hypothetical protein